MLDPKLLASLATPASYERGEELFDRGAVIRLVKMGKVYESEVMGTLRYHQTWDLRGEEPVAVCSCPYAYGGICKHLVAAGLAIFRRKFTEVLPDYEREDIPGAEGFYEANWLPADERIQGLFLEQAFAKQPNLREAFVRFLRQQEQGPSFEDIDKLRPEIRQRLESLEFREGKDVDLGHMPRYEGFHLDQEDFLEEAARDKMELSLAPWILRMRRYLGEGNLLDALKIYLGLYEGSFGVEAPAHDDFFVLGDYPEEIRSLLLEVGGELNEGLREAIIAYPVNQKLIQLIFERWSYYENRYQKGGGNRYELSFFFPLLELLAFDEVSARQLDTRLQGFGLWGPELAPLHLHIARIYRDEARWEQTAEAAFTHDPELAISLMDHYRAKNASERFLHVAREAFAAFTLEIAPYLWEHLDQTAAPELYKEVLRLHTTQVKSLEVYRKWRALASQEEVDAFIQDSTSPTNWHIDLLTEEKRYDDILAFAKKALTPWNMKKVLPPILDKHPSFCYDALSTEIEKQLQTAGDRGKYQEVCRLMKLLLQVPGYDELAKILVDQTYALRRPSLKEEMRKMGLVEKD